MENTIRTTKSTITDSGAVITVSIERGTWTHDDTLDGAVIGKSTDLINRSEITIIANSKTATSSEKPTLREAHDKAPDGAYAHIMSIGWIGQQTYNTIMTLIAEVEAEVGKSDEYVAIEQAQIAKMNKIEADWAVADQKNKGAGWCNNCQSYCYGDCQA
ncbi:MAG TPA: hypothetical protein VMW28_02955 [Pelolinea sp.]|nr:hypothetical protein [Pelolinea sp.]